MYKRNGKNVVLIWLTIILTFVLGFCSFSLDYSVKNNTQAVKYYDKAGNKYSYDYDVVFTDSNGNEYTYDYDNTRYDYLYKNGTDEKYDTDLCFLDSQGYFYYDEDLSIVAKDETCCVDTDGSIYYPIKYTKFNEDGTINYNYTNYKSNFTYDRFGNAYPEEYIPYYDEQGNKYLYSFDSNTLKGVYTNIATGETFENEHSFVDENGYFVYDEYDSFIEQTDNSYVKEYKDSSGNIYYWASSIFWNENGELLDSYGNVIQ